MDQHDVAMYFIGILTFSIGMVVGIGIFLMAQDLK